MTSLMMENIIALIGAVGGATAVVETAKFVLTRRSKQRESEAEADDKWFAKYEHQLDRMNSQIEFKDKRIEDLNNDLAGKEQRFAEQTDRLRECQDRAYASQLEVQRLTEENCQLQLQLKDQRCWRLKCLDREPKNQHTKRAEAEAAAGAAVVELNEAHTVATAAAKRRPKKQKNEND